MRFDLRRDFVGVTEFRSDVRSSLKRVEETNRPLVITKGGKPNVVVMSVALYEELSVVMEEQKALKKAEDGGQS